MNQTAADAADAATVTNSGGQSAAAAQDAAAASATASPAMDAASAPAAQPPADDSADMPPAQETPAATTAPAQAASTVPEDVAPTAHELDACDAPSGEGDDDSASGGDVLASDDCVVNSPPESDWSWLKPTAYTVGGLGLLALLGASGSGGTLPAEENTGTETLTLTGGSADVIENADDGTTVGRPVVASGGDTSVTLRYTIIDGNDGNAFTIDPVSGQIEVSDGTELDYEDQSTYTLTVQVSDGTSTATADYTITLVDINDAPVISSGANVRVDENTTAVATIVASDEDGDTLTYSISGGDDAALFTIDSSTGALSFIDAPDYENPTDADGNNVYDVIVAVSDGSATTEREMSITVRNVAEAPEFTSDASYTVDENQTSVGTVTATDSDGNTVTYSITGGDDAALFTIDSSTGTLSFVSAPDYEDPTDADVDNVYDVTVTASDGSLTTTQDITVTVDDVAETALIDTTTLSKVLSSGTTTSTTTASETDSISAALGAADSSALTLQISGSEHAVQMHGDFSSGSDGLDSASYDTYSLQASLHDDLNSHDATAVS